MISLEQLIFVFLPFMLSFHLDLDLNLKLKSQFYFETQMVQRSNKSENDFSVCLFSFISSSM